MQLYHFYILDIYLFYFYHPINLSHDLNQNIPCYFLLNILLFSLLAGCITICSKCPKEDVIIPIPTPFGIYTILIPEGTFDNKDNYFTQQEWEEFQKKKLKDKEWR